MNILKALWTAWKFRRAGSAVVVKREFGRWLVYAYRGTATLLHDVVVF